MVEVRRHAAGVRAMHKHARRPLGVHPQLRGVRHRGALTDVFGSDREDGPSGGHFRWLMSTCLAAAIGALAIVVIVYGSSDSHDTYEGILPAFKRISEMPEPPPIEATLRKDGGLRWAVPKSDKLAVTTGTMTTRYVVHDTLKQRRGNRDYIYAKPYVRIVMRLASPPPNYADVIPPFNPYKLYANTQPIGASDEARAPQTSTDVNVKIVELLGGILPGEDGQELDTAEVNEIVERAHEAEQASTAIKEEQAENAIPAANGDRPHLADPADDTKPQPNTTVLAKIGSEQDDAAADLQGLKRLQKTVVEGDTLAKILGGSGAETWMVRAILDAARPLFKEQDLKPGFEVQIGLAPSVTQQNRLEPVVLSVFDEGHAHKVTVTRNAAGEYVVSPDLVGEDASLRLALSDDNAPQPASVYASLYAASLMQQVQPEAIQQILRVHATETDFRRRVRPGDGVELFFDLKDDDTGLEGPPGDLLYTAITNGDETRRFYRFRAADGTVDFYDEEGNNSKKFLTRKPVRGDDARIVSGFGVRLHPLLNVRRMHTGVDWASPPGTPILAAGNGVVEEVGHKGGYGNYVRIRHANGYQTAYGHISRFAPGMAPGVKIKQNQVIAYVGCTGLCQGPHVHFEVLINNQFVDPLSIQVPNERQLAGKDMQEFQAERARIDELRARSPVATATR